MRITSAFISQMNADISSIKNRSAIGVFPDNMSLGAVLEKAYITPNYHLRKHNEDCLGIAPIYKNYKNKNVVFVGGGGTGKTTAFLRLYTGTEESIEAPCNEYFLYCFAPDLEMQTDLSGYKKRIRNAILSGQKIDGIVLLDGLEEAYWDDPEKAIDRIKKLYDSGNTIWVACRTNFYEKIYEETNLFFTERIEIENWIPEDFEEFVNRCLSSNQKKTEILQKIHRVKTNLASLIARPLFATMMLFVAQNNDLDSIENEYELIKLFLDKWIDTEGKKRIVVNDESYVCIRNTALLIYQKTSIPPLYNDSLKAFRDLLVIGKNRSRSTIHGFFHREFLNYFIGNALIDAALYHPERIIQWYSQTFYNDITNLIKPKIACLSREDTSLFYNNLFSIYRQTYENVDQIENAFKALGFEERKYTYYLLRLRDELLYFILRLKNIDYQSFVHYAYEKSTDIMINLGIAYGMARIDPNNRYTLEFAKKLTPMSDEDIRNRGWAMCFYGDFKGDGYTYDDTEGRAWTKIRNNRLERLKNPEKYATRVLDIPLLYCFYNNRGFRDCTSFMDYEIIRDTNISLMDFGDEQKEFMAQRKKQLESIYLKHLLTLGIETNISIVKGIGKEKIKMSEQSKNTILEINASLQEQILKQIEDRETIRTSIAEFWKKDGIKLSEKYLPLSVPTHKSITRQTFLKKIKKCKVLIITANSVEGIIVSRRLMQINNGKELDAFSVDGSQYLFTTIKSKNTSIPVVHIWPSDTSSFTQFGSFYAVDKALDKFNPKYVLSIGVAFGIDPHSQSIGDVLISKSLVFYDHFNKVTDGEMVLKPQEVYQISTDITSQVHQIDLPDPPKNVGTFRWHSGSILTGGTVLSDATEKAKLISAAKRTGYTIIGGEMEASGIYYACQKVKDRSIPFLVIKGICDWGAEKNAWKEVIDSNLDGESIKNAVQAFACDNAYDSMCFILSQLNME